MPLDITPVAPGLGFGVAVCGVELSNIAQPDIAVAPRDAFVRHGLILFKEPDVSNEFHVRLSAVLVHLIIHRTAPYKLEGHPELIQLIYKPQKKPPIEVDGEVLGGNIPWHFYMVFPVDRSRGGILWMELHNRATAPALLVGYATDETGAYFHHRQRSDELLLWDNGRRIHKACGVPPSHRDPHDDRRRYGLARQIQTRSLGDHGTHD